jgi:hypothetical protein
MKGLRKGDTLSLTIGINMSTGEDRGSPWVRAEAMSITTVGENETYKEAKVRLYNEVYKRADSALNKVVKEVQEG